MAFRTPVHIAMAGEGRGKEMVREEEDFVAIEEEGGPIERTQPMCLIGKVLTRKPFNAFDFLEAMKRAMEHLKGFTVKEIGLNLFSFQFRSHGDLLEVKRMEPWHFEKSLVILKEIGEGEQPLEVEFKTTALWIRLYDLPPAAISEKYIRSIASRCGEILEVGKDSTEGFGRNIRVKVNLDITQPLRTCLKIMSKEGRPAWIPFKFERLPSFCFLCGMIGHMKRECDFVGKERIPNNTG
ncbi:hypothetical protein ACS0TY_035621 [Phlomoides rotata]